MRSVAGRPLLLSLRRSWRASSMSSSSRSGRCTSRCRTALSCRHTALSASNPISICGPTSAGRSPTAIFSFSASSTSSSRCWSASRSRLRSINASRAKPSGARSFSIPSPSRSWSPAQSGAGSTAPTPASSSSCGAWAGTTSPSASQRSKSTAIYAIIATGIWQSSGFAMALFLAGLRSVDPDIIKAAQIDGAGPVRIYRKVILPTIAPIFVAVAVVLLQFAIKTFDLVVALTQGGPGISTTFPANYVYDLMFQRGQIAIGAAASIMMLLALAVVLVPYALWSLYSSRRVSRPWLTRPSTPRSIPMRAPPTFAMLGVAHRHLLLPRVLCADLSPAALRHRRQLVPRAAGDHPQRADRAAAKPLVQGLAAGMGALLRRRDLRGHQTQFLQLADHDDPGDDRLDAARRDQWLCPFEVALSRLGDALRLHDARRFHAGPDRAPALGLHPRRAVVSPTRSMD